MDPSTIHKITRGEIEHILKCLKLIDESRDELAAHGADAEPISELRKCSDGIYHIVNKLPEA